MKKYIKFIIPMLLVTLLLSGCGGAKDVKSRDEANRVLLSASSVIAECEKTLDEYDNILEDTKMSAELKLNKVKEKDLSNIEKRLDGAYSDIVACDSYKDVEDVKPKYDSSMDKYERAVKHIGFIRKDLEKLEKEK